MQATKKFILNISMCLYAAAVFYNIQCLVFRLIYLNREKSEMKCNYCNSEWTTTFKISSCPFCHMPLEQNSEKMDIKMALNKIITDFGTDVLKTPDKLIACIMDYVIGHQKDKKMIRIASENGIFDVMWDARNTPNTEAQKALCEKAILILKENAFLSQENANYIVYLIADGLNIAHSQIKNANDQSTSIEQDQEKDQSNTNNISSQNKKQLSESGEKKPNDVGVYNVLLRDLWERNMRHGD